MRTPLTTNRITGVFTMSGMRKDFFQVAEYHTEEGGELKPTITHWPVPERASKTEWTYMFLLKNAEDCYRLFE
jgi:hypothetical protein